MRVSTANGRRTSALVALASLLAAGCAESSGGTSETTPAIVSDATLALVVAEQSPTTLTVDLHYSPKPDQARPRMMELHLQVSDGLTYSGSEALGATLDADKDLIVQDAGDGVLRTVVMSTRNMNLLEAGPLARYHFTRASGGGSATLTVLDRAPIFAPAPANTGLLLPDPLVVKEASP